jgi:hypothetical protein
MPTTNSIEQKILKDVLNNPGDTFYENVLSDFLDEQGVEHDFRKPLHNNKIEKLKPYQKKCLAVWANHWTNVGLCTRPTDEDKAWQYFSDLYKELGFSKPKNIVWFDNPIKMCKQTNCLNNQLSNQICTQIYNLIWTQANKQIQDHLKKQIWDKISNQICTQIYNLICIQVWDQVWYQVRNQISNYNWNKIFYGQHDVYSLAAVAYYMQTLRIKTSKAYIPYILLAQEVNWWFPTEETIYVTKKPKECVVVNGKFVKLVYQDNYAITNFSHQEQILQNLVNN